MKIMIYHGHGFNNRDYKLTLFDTWEAAELHYCNMLGKGYSVCGGTVACEENNRAIIVGINPKGRFLTLPLHLA